MAVNQIVSRGHTRPLTEISFTRDGTDTLLVSSAHDKLPQIRNGETGDWIGSFEGHKGAVWSCKVDPRTRSLAATASGDFSAKLWCATTGREIHEFKHKHVVRSVDFSNDTLMVATGCQDGLVRIYDTCAPEKSPREYKVSIDGPSGSPVKVIWCNEAEPMTLIVGKKDGVIEKYDTRQSDTNACCKVEMSKSKTTIMDLEYKPDQNILMVACDDKVHALSCSDLSSLKEFTMPKGMHFREEGGVSLHPDGSKFIAGASDLWLREFDFHSGDILQTLKGHHGPIRCVRYHPNGMYGASGSEDATIRLWELTSTEEGTE